MMEADGQCYMDEFEQFRARAFSGGDLPFSATTERRDCDSRGSADGGPRSGQTPEEEQEEEDTTTDWEVYRVTSQTPGTTPTICCHSCENVPTSPLTPSLLCSGPRDEPRTRSSSLSPIRDATFHQRPRLSDGNCNINARSRSSSSMCKPTSPKLLQCPQFHPQGLWSEAGPPTSEQGDRQQDDAAPVDHTTKCGPRTTNKLDDRVLSHMAWTMLDDDDWILGDMRPRITSMPSRPFRRSRWGRDHPPSLSQLRRSPIPGETHRVKSYAITPKGVVIKGDVYLSRSSTSVASNESESTTHSAGSIEQPVYRVLVIGEPGVGKRALVQSFLSPDSPDNNLSSFDEDDVERTVSLLLDSEESTLEFIDVTNQEVGEQTAVGDAYMVVYSVEHQHSFECALDRLNELRKKIERPVAIILVANKADLVRNRVVLEEEGRAAANSYDCKYIEVSAAIDHKIDDLLVGILKQIRLKRRNAERSCKVKPPSRARADDSCCQSLLRAHHNVLSRFFRGDKPTSRSCENLYEL